MARLVVHSNRRASFARIKRRCGGRYLRSTPPSLGFVRRDIPSFSLRTDTPPLELALEPARRLQVWVVDPEGRALDARNLRLRAEDGWSVEQTPRLGACTFPKVPRRPLELTIEIGKRTWTESVDATQERVRVQIEHQ